MYRSLFFLAFFLVNLSLSYEKFRFGTPYAVNLVDSEFQITEGTSGIAYGVYDYDQKNIGWNILNVLSNSSYPDNKQAFAAGYLEGALTAMEMWNGYLTWNETSGDWSDAVLAFVVDQDLWVHVQAFDGVYVKPDEVQYWMQVRLVLLQFDGLLAGYNRVAPIGQKLTYYEFLLYQLVSELYDIQSAVNESSEAPSPRESMLRSHCSSLTKLTSDNLYSSHVTWTQFAGMLRIFKSYKFPYSLESTKIETISFSGFPGFLPSGDDWYINDQNMTIAETTNNIYNMALYKNVTFNTVPYWIRVLVANRMADNGQLWTEIFSMYNSGTYNNQWIIVDYKLYTPGKPLQPNTLWIAEQIPGYVISADMTQHLQSTGYWPSYNTPYFSFVYNISGYLEAYEKYGDIYSWSMCPRAQIFRRDQGKINNMTSMRSMMRYNEWQTDPLSLGDSCNAISARCDLDPPSIGAAAFGGIDAKVTDYNRVSKMTSSAVMGPTWDAQPPFAWTEEWNWIPHYGQVKVFDFDFVEIRPAHMN